METNDEIQFRYSLPKGVFWWLVWVLALLSNLFALVFCFMTLFVMAMPRGSSFKLSETALMLMFLLLTVCSAVAVLAMMHTDKPDAVNLRRKVGAIANILLTIFASAHAVVSGKWPILLIVGLYTGLNCFVIFSNCRRVGEGVCLSCGYNLTGNTTGHCPECGHTIAAGEADPTSKLD